jgi:hypothetical protein
MISMNLTKIPILIRKTGDSMLDPNIFRETLGRLLFSPMF